MPEQDIPQLDHQDHHHQQLQHERPLLVELLVQELIPLPAVCNFPPTNPL